MFQEHYRLTTREMQITELCVDSKNAREIAFELTIGYQTVRNHIKSIYNKLGVKSRIELANTWNGAHGKDTDYNLGLREQILRLTEETEELRAQLHAMTVERNNWKNRACRATRFALSSK